MKSRSSKRVVCYAFIDAANLFYGGEKSLGWSIDYEKLLRYLEQKYHVQKAYYYAGVELDGYPYSILDPNSIDIEQLLRLQLQKLSTNLSEAELIVLQKHIQRVKFYRKLEQFGYLLCLKPTKIFWNNDTPVKKANCDVDLTFDMMRYMNDYQEAVLLSGDGAGKVFAE